MRAEYATFTPQLSFQEQDVGMLQLCETRVSSGTLFHHPGYTVFRKDRLGRPAGGVVVLNSNLVDFDTQIEAVSLILSHPRTLIGRDLNSRRHWITGELMRIGGRCLSTNT